MEEYLLVGALIEQLSQETSAGFARRRLDKAQTHYGQGQVDRMSTTIGIGYSPTLNTNLFHSLEIVANKFGYGLLNGISHAEQDVLDGLEATQKNEGWENIIILKSPQTAQEV